MKTCFKCARMLPLDDFYRHPQMGDGHLGKCKDCTKRDVRLNRDQRLDYYRSYDKTRPRRESLVSREWSSKHSRAHSAAKRAHPESQPCESCGLDGRHRHHPDYGKPTEIVWLCTSCHGREHARLRRERVS